MKLTPKQEAFCLAYLETGNASEAYRLSYNAGKMKPESVNRKAKELIDNGKIAARLDELRQPAVKAAQITMESHLADLKMLRDKALEAEQFSAAITAETNRGKAAGLYVEKLDLSSKDGSMSPKPAIDVSKLSDAALDEIIRLADDAGADSGG